MYKAEVYDDKGEEMPFTIHLLHELISNYYIDTARVGFLLSIAKSSNNG
jgi:hypothetical protein